MTAPLTTINRLRTARDEMNGVIEELISSEIAKLNEHGQRLWICTDHATHYPVGAASIVIAPDEDQARELLRAELERIGLSADRFTLKEVPLHPAAHILCNGDY